MEEAMNDHYSKNRKINGSRRRPDGTPDDNNRAEIGPTPLAFAEWADAGLDIPNLAQMRKDRHVRLVQGLKDRGYGAALLSDPFNIRFATDSSNMQVWNMHNHFRAVFVTADGFTVLFDARGLATRLYSDFNPAVNEIRFAASMFYCCNGNLVESVSKDYANVVDELMTEHASNKRIAIDKIAVSGFRALAALGYEVEDGEELMERVRSVKGADEIKAIRCSIYSTEMACRIMEDSAAPGMTENDIWSVLHAENIRRGGEFIETRLLASGPRTNPYLLECGPRVVQDGELVAYDTDLIGPYGMCADISRTFWVGSGGPTEKMKRFFRVAVEHIRENTEMLRPGMSFREISFGGHNLADEFVESRYCCKMHGVGVTDEWPLIVHPQDWRDGVVEHVLEPGMVFSVEALVAHKGGDFSIKLENQVLITETGVENMTRLPYDTRFLE